MICVVVLSLSFCCTMEASVTKTHSSYEKIYLAIIKLILILILIINKRSYECLGLFCILNVRGGEMSCLLMKPVKESLYGDGLCKSRSSGSIIKNPQKIINIRTRLRIIIGNLAEFCLKVLPCL